MPTPRRPAVATLNRRSFLLRAALAPAAAAWAARGADAPARVRFGLMADVHHDIIPDAPARVGAFVGAMEKAGADFIIELGDFCQSKPEHRDFLAVWDRFRGARHHVLGNHEMDSGFTREQSAAFRGMPAPHHAFEAGPIRGIVLDGNEPGGKVKGYPKFVGPDQQRWIEETIAASEKPAVLFIHQPFDRDGPGLENAAEMRALLAKSEAAHPGRVLAVFSGHLHEDYLRTVDGIPHIQINSASDVWLPAEAARDTFPPEVHAARPHLRRVAAYRDPLWALATVDLARGELTIEGRRSEWIGPDPWARGATEEAYSRETVRPAISDRRCALGRKAPAK